MLSTRPSDLGCHNDFFLCKMDCFQEKTWKIFYFILKSNILNRGERLDSQIYKNLTSFNQIFFNIIEKVFFKDKRKINGKTNKYLKLL